MAISRFTAMIAAALVLASCGRASDEGAGSLLQPPRPVDVVDSPALAAAQGRLSSDATLSSMPAFTGFTYEAGPDLAALPTNSTGYQYPPGVTVDAATVAELASALGVEGEPVPGGGADVDGLAWRVGPDDGSAPSLTVGADAQLSVNYSTAWGGVTSVGCALAADGGGASGGVSTDAVTPAESANDAVTPVPSTTLAVPTDTICPEVEAPVDVPAAEEAEALAADVLAEVGLDPASFSFDTYADEWSASVTAFSQLDGVRSPVAWGFGFGENSQLQWMNGTLAIPIATGPYPLIGLDEALQRLEEQNMWFGRGGAVMNDMAVTGDAMTDVVPESPVSVPVESLPVDEVPSESLPGGTIPVEVTVSTLVDVRADLWWAWGDDGSVWLLPAYTFTDTEDRTFTVAAVTDEFLIIADPVVVDPMPLDPSPVEPAPVDPAYTTTVAIDTNDIIGRGVDDATKVLDGRGLTLRIVTEDGVALAITEDYSSSRVNVEVTDGVVTAIVSIG